MSYTQSAGFLKVLGGEEPLDGTMVHPESYPLAAAVLRAAGLTRKCLGNAMGSTLGVEADVEGKGAQAEQAVRERVSVAIGKLSDTELVGLAAQVKLDR